MIEQDTNDSTSVQTAGLRFLGALVVLSSVAIGLAGLLTGLWPVAVSGVAGIAVDLFISILLKGEIILTEEMIEARELLRTYRMAWSDVTKMQIDPKQHAIRFSGHDRVLVVLGPHYWVAGAVNEMREKMNDQARRRGVEIAQARATFFLPNRGTRSKSKTQQMLVLGQETARADFRR